MSKEMKMELHEYIELAKTLSKARQYIIHASKIINGFRKKDLRVLMKSLSSLQMFHALAEDRMWNEYPHAPTTIFYPPDQYYTFNLDEKRKSPLNSSPKISLPKISLFPTGNQSYWELKAYVIKEHQTKAGHPTIRVITYKKYVIADKLAEYMSPWIEKISFKDTLDIIQTFKTGSRAESLGHLLAVIEKIRKVVGDESKSIEQGTKQLYESKRKDFCPVCNITVPNTAKNRNLGWGALACPNCLTVVNWKGSIIPHHEFQLKDSEGSLGIQYDPHGFGYPWLWHVGCNKGEYGQNKTLGHFRIEKIWLDPDSKLRDKEKNWSARLVLGLRCEQCDLVNCLKFGVYGTPKAIPIYIRNGDPNRILIIEDKKRIQKISVKRIKMELETKEYEKHLKEPVNGFLTKEEMLSAARKRATGETYRRSTN